MSRIVKGDGALLVIPPDRLGPLYEHVGLTAVMLVTLNGNSPGLMAASEVEKLIDDLDPKKFSSGGIDALRADLGVLREEHGLAATVEEVLNRVAAKAVADTGGDVFRFALCDCGLEYAHGHIQLADGCQRACRSPFLSRVSLLQGLAAWVEQRKMTPQNACNIMAQASMLPALPPQLPEGIKDAFGRMPPGLREELGQLLSGFDVDSVPSDLADLFARSRVGHRREREPRPSSILDLLGFGRDLDGGRRQGFWPFSDWW